MEVYGLSLHFRVRSIELKIKDTLKNPLTKITVPWGIQLPEARQQYFTGYRGWLEQRAEKLLQAISLLEKYVRT